MALCSPKFANVLLRQDLDLLSLLASSKEALCLSLARCLYLRLLWMVLFCLALKSAPWVPVIASPWRKPVVFCFVGSLGNMASVLLLVKIPIVLFLLPLFVSGLPYPRLSLSYVLVVCCGFDRLLKLKLMVKLDWNLLLSLADLRLWNPPLT